MKTIVALSVSRLLLRHYSYIVTLTRLDSIRSSDAAQGDHLTRGRLTDIHEDLYSSHVLLYCILCDRAHPFRSQSGILECFKMASLTTTAISSSP